MKDTLQQVADTLTNKPTLVTIDFAPVNRWERWLQKLKLKPKQHTFALTPLRVANIYRIAARAQQIENDTLREALTQNKCVQEAVQDAIVSHVNDIVYIVAVGLHNGRSEPDKALLTLIEQEFTAADLAKVMGLLLNAMNLADFLTSIVSIRSLDVLTPKETSRTAGEIIAPGAL